MTSLFRTCLDGHRCENGSSCAEHPTEEGKYYCDCNTSSGDFSGLFCEYQAETYCQMPQETTESWFCSNMGTCVLSTGGQGAQWNCDCPSDFEGPVRRDLVEEESVVTTCVQFIVETDIIFCLFGLCSCQKNCFSAALSIYQGQCSERLAGFRL